MKLTLFTSAFCAPCHAARATVAQAQELVPGLEVTELDVAAHTAEAEAAEIRSTPTLVIEGDAGSFRAAGAPSLDQLLRALASVSA
ncbi:glutaredoxin family protein [Okibacterium fritillariae]|uniref:glutaredoxin family protein n=1 Tax=Okibacterium fritillariae TaxID=123320 RepID=UPI004055562C